MRCLVLGGTGAVGSAVCELLAARGASLAFTYCVREARAAEIAASVAGAVPLRLDLRAAADVERTVARAEAALGGLDALVQCAGVALTVPGASASSPQRIADIDATAWDAMQAVNLRGSFLACRAALPHLRRAGGGNIVLLGSVDMCKGVPVPVHYAASKAALGGMARAFAKEVGPHNLRVNVVAPGLLEGGIALELPEELRAEYLKHCAFKRVGRLAEVAEVVAWLALENTYLNGQTVPVDGGL
jgi:NAD(P)-dependent dehydrogenase (short-subunit alcohol dehydrogenase family)